jgi:hypothetical protein
MAQFGLVPALEALARDAPNGVTVEATGLPEPLPEPLRTSLYRLIETALSTARPGASQPLAAVRVRVALLSGSLQVEPSPDGRARVLVRLPFQGLPPPGPTGSVARTTVLPGADSTSS